MNRYHSLDAVRAFALIAGIFLHAAYWSVKYVLIIVMTMGVLLTSYHHLVRSTFVGQFLNGRRYPRGTHAAVTPDVSPG